MDKRLIVTVTALATLMLAGCATEQPAPEPEPVKLEVVAGPGINVTFADVNIANALVVASAKMTKAGMLPKLNLTFKNRTQMKFPMEYQVQWLDADGAPIPTSAAWHRLTMTGNAYKSLTSTGRSLEARTADVTVRFPTDVEIYVPEPDPVEEMRLQQQMQQQAIQGAQY